MSQSMSKELGFALDLCKQAGELLLSYFSQGVEVSVKDDKSPVTIADRASERLIREAIHKLYPDDSVLGEEEAPHKAAGQRKWIVDPLDGTYNFARGIDIFSVLLALEDSEQIVLGVVHNPARNETYYAEAGNGAFKNGQRLRVSDISSIQESQFLFGAANRIAQSQYWQGFTSLIRDTCRQRGPGDYLDFAYVFEGKGEAMIEVGLSPWDIAPMKVIVEEAGGRFSDLAGGDSIYTGDCLVSNGKVHEAFLSRLKMT